MLFDHDSIAGKWDLNMVAISDLVSKILLANYVKLTD